jgi:hypothetical protein
VAKVTHPFGELLVDNINHQLSISPLQEIQKKAEKKRQEMKNYDYSSAD